MAQVKKAEVRQAIVKSALRLFKRKGYVSTTTAQIAAGAGISEANLYVYFRSKFEILFELYEPWFRDRFVELEERLGREAEPRARLRILLTALWRDIPHHDNGFTNNLMQALTTVARAEGYRPDLLQWIEGRIETLIRAAIPPRRRAQLARGDLAHVLMMAQDGFAMNVHLNPSTPCSDESMELFCDLILGGRNTARGG